MGNSTEKIDLYYVHRAILDGKKIICPKCKKGYIETTNTKRPLAFWCSEECGWFANIDYADCIVE